MTTPRIKTPRATTPRGDELSIQLDSEVVDALTELMVSGPLAIPEPGSAREGHLISADDWVGKHYIYQSTDPRDRVFALCGCFEDSLRSRITIDYSRSADEVFKKLISLIIKATCKLNILVDACPESWVKMPVTSPSWARRMILPDASNVKPIHMLMNASGSCNALYQFLDGDVLKSKAIFICTVNKNI
jgi:hypothetical protein